VIRPFQIALNRLRTWITPYWLLPTGILLYVLFEVADFIMRWSGRFAAPDLFAVLYVRDEFAVVFIAFAGLLRAQTNHPFFWQEYGRWLARTPWQSPKPLPFGPIHLGWTDLAFIGIAALALHNPTFDLLRIPLVFLTGYLLAICVGLWRTGTKVWAYILSFGLPLVVRLWDYPLDATAVVTILYIPAFVGIQQSLKEFPWSISLLPPSRDPPTKTAANKEINELLGIERPKKLGWPFDHLQPHPADIGIHPRDGALASALLGWWIYCFTTPLELRLRLMLLQMAMVLPVWMVIARLAIYVVAYQPPINVWGRLWTFRWIIPSYDKVFVAPLLTLLVPWGAFYVFVVRMQLDPLLVVPVTLGCALLATLNMGPTMHKWRLIGNHRIAPKYQTLTHFRL
jgi:hypothetical protein